MPLIPCSNVISFVAILVTTITHTFHSVSCMLPLSVLSWALFLVLHTLGIYVNSHIIPSMILIFVWRFRSLASSAFSPIGSLFIVYTIYRRCQARTLKRHQTVLKASPIGSLFSSLLQTSEAFFLALKIIYLESHEKEQYISISCPLWDLIPGSMSEFT
jgi:hypothetical protein